MAEAKQSKFRELTFPNKEALDKWLKKNASKIITLNDFGQDMSKIWVHESGEILHSDWHGDIYSGKFIDMENLSEGKPLSICDNNSSKYEVYVRLVVYSITDNK